MKDKLLALIDELSKVYLTELPDLLPDYKGEYAMYAPLKDGYNPNVLLVTGVSQDFISLFNELYCVEKLLEIEPVPVVMAMIDGCPLYSMPFADVRKIETTRHECFLPAVLKRKPHTP